MWFNGRRLHAALVRLSAVCLIMLAGVGCSEVDLSTSLEITDWSSGYHDAGVTDLGANKLVPSVSFRIKNISGEPINSVNLMIMFWGVEFEEPKELDEVLLTGIDSAGIGAGDSTDVIVVHSKQGFALEQQPRSELFNHRAFRDVTAKVFMRRGGRIVPFGEFTIDRRLLLAAPQ